MRNAVVSPRADRASFGLAIIGALVLISSATYDQKFYNIKMPEGTELTVQDRAYTSPILYTPQGS